MNNHRKIALLIAVAFVFTAVFAYADKYPARGVVTGDNVYVRAGNSKKYETLRTFDKGKEVTVLGLSGSYYLLKCPSGVPVWIYAKYVDVNGKNGTVNATKVNVRARKKSGTVVCQVNKPEKLRIIEKSGDWLRIEAPSKAKIYMHKDYVELLPEKTPPPKETKNTQPGKTPEPTPAPMDKWQKKFEEAEKAFQTEQGKPPLSADFEKVKRMYEKIVASPEAEELHADAKRRIAVCDFYIQQKKALEDLKDKNEDLEKRLEQLKRELDEKLRKLREARQEKEEEEKVEYVATGVVYSMGVVINRPATHKLYKGKEVLYMLKSETINLDDYWGLYVGIQGTVVPAPQGWDYDIIEVTEVTILDHEKRTPPRD